jgi:hypothetical protein
MTKARILLVGDDRGEAAVLSDYLRLSDRYEIESVEYLRRCTEDASARLAGSGSVAQSPNPLAGLVQPDIALLDFLTRRRFMHNAMPLSLAALIAVGIIVIGCFYLVSPERISGTFGLKPPSSDADTRAWLRPKGIRDVVAGLVVLTMMLTADKRSVGIVLLVEAIIPLGDMSIILGAGGSKSRAFSIHGVTSAVMLVVGLLLIHAI